MTTLPSITASVQCFASFQPFAEQSAGFTLVFACNLNPA